MIFQIFQSNLLSVSTNSVPLHVRDVTVGDHFTPPEGMPSGVKQPINAALQHTLRKDLTQALAALPEADATGTAVAKLAGKRPDHGYAAYVISSSCYYQLNPARRRLVQLGNSPILLLLLLLLLLSLLLRTLLFSGAEKWEALLDKLCDQYAAKGQANMAAMLSLLLHDPLRAVQYYRCDTCWYCPLQHFQ
jgi:hypothetical protein